MIPQEYNLAPSENPVALMFNIEPKVAAFMLNTTDEALNHRRSRGNGPAFAKVGGRVRYSYATLEAYAKERGIELRPAGVQVLVDTGDDGVTLN